MIGQHRGKSPTTFGPGKYSTAIEPSIGPITGPTEAHKISTNDPNNKVFVYKYDKLADLHESNMDLDTRVLIGPIKDSSITKPTSDSLGDNSTKLWLSFSANHINPTPNHNTLAPTTPLIDITSQTMPNSSNTPPKELHVEQQPNTNST